MNLNVICKLINFMRRPFGGHILLYTYICLLDFDYIMDLFYFILFYGDITQYYGPLWSTYDRGRIWGDLIFHSTEAVWEMIAREEWLGCRHVVAHVGHTRVNTSVGSMLNIFRVFLIYKLYGVCFKTYIYCIKQKHWWSLTLSWPDMVQRTFLTAH